MYLNYLSAYMANNPEIHNPGYNTLRDIASSEYGLLDKISFSVVSTHIIMYQQLYTIDMRKFWVDVPVYFFLGRHDVNANSTVEEYMQVLIHLIKIVWFEHSGHSPWINGRKSLRGIVMLCRKQPSRIIATTADYHHSGDFSLYSFKGQYSNLRIPMEQDAKWILRVGLENKYELSLNKGDVLQIEVDREEERLRDRGQNGSEPYRGNNLESGMFTVTVCKTDQYDKN